MFAWLTVCGAGAQVNIYPYLCDPPQDGKASIVCLCSHFRLLQTCELLNNGGSLETINAVLGCPLGMFDMGDDVKKVRGGKATRRC